MRVLRSATAIAAEVSICPDQQMVRLLSCRLRYAEENDDPSADLLQVLFIEPGDSLRAIDAHMEGQFLVNHYSGKRFGDQGFKPCFETLEEYPSFYEMFFVQSDEGHGLALLIPKRSGIVSALLNICSVHSTPAPDLPS